MVVDFTALLQGTHQFSVTLTPAWWQSKISDYQVVGLEKPVIANLTVRKDQTGYFIQGSVSGVLNVECGRCLALFDYTLKPDFDFHASFASPSSVVNTDVELVEKDFTVAGGDEGKVDLQELVMEQIFLSLPMRLLCTEDCLGLCPECGTNLNGKKCDCRKHTGHSAFLKLKGLEFPEG